MYIRKNTRKYKGKTYENYLLVESINTPAGPRQKTICSLGNLAPGPREEWSRLAHRLQAALQGHQTLEENDPEFEKLLQIAKNEKITNTTSQTPSRRILPVDTDAVEITNPRSAGPVHVGHQLWKRLKIDTILLDLGFSQAACKLTEAMTLNRLIFPLSEYSMPHWFRTTALEDILQVDFSSLNEDVLYRHLDSLHPNREVIEKKLAETERILFNLKESIFLYDLTSTYFEGKCESNPQAKRGYSRDKRPDCKQVIIGLVVDEEGFPKAHEIFEGNVQDRKTLPQMFDALEKRVGRKTGGTIIVDRGMAYEENLDQIRERGFCYIVGGRQSERNQWLDEFEKEDGWKEIIRNPSPRNPFQKKSKVRIKQCKSGEEIYVLCHSEGRREKDRAIREKHEKRLISDLEKLKKRINDGRLKDLAKIHQAIGRIRERYPRVCRYYQIEFVEEKKSFFWTEDSKKKELAANLDGSYVLRTNRQDLSEEEIWKTYIFLTRIENAFRDLKGPLLERPIFHKLKNRTQTHIFFCLLAYHLLVSIEKIFLDQGIHTSWKAIRDELQTHQTVTVELPSPNKGILEIRKGTSPTKGQREIYRILKISPEIMKPVKIWKSIKNIVTEKNQNSALQAD